MQKTIKSLLAGLLIALAFCLQAPAESVPFSTNVTITAGSGSFTYSSSIRKDYASSFKVLAVIGKCTAGQTNTYLVVDGGVTNKLGAGTKVVAASDAALAVTSDWPHFRTSKVLITSTDTNAFTVTLIGVED